jgi:hypothetical protein
MINESAIGVKHCGVAEVARDSGGCEVKRLKNGGWDRDSVDLRSNNFKDTSLNNEEGHALESNCCI